VQDSSGNSKRAYRRHDLDLKRHLVRLCGEPGASVAAIAREHGINANMLFMWRKEFGAPAAADSSVLLPVQVVDGDKVIDAASTIAPTSPRKAARGAAAPSLIEIELTGVLVRLRGTVDEANLCSVLRAVRGTT